MIWWLLIVGVVLAYVYYKFIRVVEPDFNINEDINKKLVVIDSNKLGQKKSNVDEDENNSNLPVLTILFYTQTGTAEDFATRLAEDMPRKCVRTVLSDVADYDLENFQNEKVVIFVVSTYGDGEPPDNAVEFHEWLMDAERENEEYFANVNYTIFGLGCSSYDKYNFTGKVINKRMKKLGAQLFHEHGEGDESKNQEEDFLKWKRDLLVSLKDVIPDFKIDEEASFRRKEKMIVHQPTEAKVKNVDINNISRWRFDGRENTRRPIDQKNPFMGKVIVNRELHTPLSDRSCRHIEISSNNGLLKYEAGDHLGIYPQNDITLVHHLASLLGVNLDSILSIRSIESNSPILGPCTLKAALLQFYDITSTIRKPMLKLLAFYCTDETEKKELLKLSSEDPLNQEFYKDEILNKSRTVLEVLKLYPNSKPPLDHFLEMLPKLQPRYYSISSSSVAHPESIHITAVLVDWITPTNRHAKGVTTHYLKDIVVPENGENYPRIPVFVRKNPNFRLPPTLDTPIIMVGPGTGLAPFRGFLQERSQMIKKNNLTINDKDILFFGCRDPEKDYLYKEELEAFHNDNCVELITAFSRVQDSKIYVQHKMLNDETSHKIWKLLTELKGNFYLCGDSIRLVSDIQKTLITIFCKYGNMNEDEGKRFLETLQKDKRYSADVW